MENWNLVIVLGCSAVQLALGAYIIDSADSVGTSEMKQVELVQASACGKLLPHYVRTIGSLAVLMVPIGILTYFGEKLNDKKTMINFYYMTTLLMVLIELRVVASRNNYRQRSLKYGEENYKISEAWSSAIEEYDLKLRAQLIIDDLQEQGTCCGINGPQDWHNRTEFIPATCCRNRISCNVTINEDIYHNGCLDYIARHYQEPSMTLFNELIILMIISIANVIFITICRVQPTIHEPVEVNTNPPA